MPRNCAIGYSLFYCHKDEYSLPQIFFNSDPVHLVSATKPVVPQLDLSFIFPIASTRLMALASVPNNASPAGPEPLWLGTLRVRGFTGAPGPTTLVQILISEPGVDEMKSSYHP